MSQLDLLAEIRAARPVAPAELRERVRDLAAGAPAPRRRLSFTWRRALVVAIPVAAALLLAGVFVQRDGKRQSGNELAVSDALSTFAPVPAEKSAADAAGASSRAFARPAQSPPPSTSRAQKYTAELELRLPTAKAVSSATNKALAIAASLGGYPLRVNVDAARKDGEAYLVLRVPRSRVQVAV